MKKKTARIVASAIIFLLVASMLLSLILPFMNL